MPVACKGAVELRGCSDMKESIISRALLPLEKESITEVTSSKGLWDKKRANDSQVDLTLCKNRL